MLYCNNPKCSQPFNPLNFQYCKICGSSNLLSVFHDRYQIIQKLGEGGFGRTYEARDKDRLNHPCVIKQLIPNNQEPDSKIIQLFHREAQQLYKFGKHSQIPELYAFFEENQQLYLVQEFIQGKNLQDELKINGIFDEEKVIQLLTQLLPVLKLLHEHQIIHRDIKPENIIRRSVVPSGEKLGDLVLIDFGISKQLNLESSTQVGTIVGTPGYAPHEQMNGQVFPASDLYSLGVTCLRLLTGILPQTTPANSLYDFTTGQWRWRERLPSKVKIKDELASILDKLTLKEIKDRYQSADEVLDDLKQKYPIEHMERKHFSRQIYEQNNCQHIGGIVLKQLNIKELVRIAKLSVPLIEMRLNDQILSSGSGLMYKQIIDRVNRRSHNYFMTNLHVISNLVNWPKILQELIETKVNIEKVNLNFVVNWNQKEYPVYQFLIPHSAILGENGFQADVQDLDFALFRIDNDSTDVLDFFGISEKSSLDIGDPLYAFGYPQGIGFAMSDGIVSQIHNNYQPGKDNPITKGTIQHNILINHGNSGGPTINEFGEIVGISTRGLSTSVAVGINFSLKIREILRSLQNSKNFQYIDTQKYLINLKKAII